MTHRVPHLPPHLEGQSSWLSKATSARILGHPLVWSGMTGLFILAGYLWLQYYARPLSDQLGQSHSDSELVGSKTGNAWNPDIYRPTESEESMPITRQADKLRAEKYRETIDLENKIQPLLSQARTYMERELYTSQDQNNAWQSYQGILDIVPDHRLAQSGQDQILGLLQDNAEYATDEFEYEEAEQWLAELDTIEANAPFQVDLRQRIADQINEEMAIQEARLRQAEKTRLLNDAIGDAKDAMQASPPKLRAAYDLYQRVLELDEKNKRALEGLKAIQLARADYAEQAITDNNYLEARAQIDRLKQIEAGANLLENLESALSEAQARQQAQQKAPVPEPVQNNTRAGPNLVPEPGPVPAVEPAPATPEKPAPDSQNIETVEIDVRKTPVKTQTGDIPSSGSPSTTKAQQLSSGINAYYKGDYNAAFTNLHPLAEANSPRAQFRLGIMYYQGRTVVKNEDLARQWIARALPA
ncbi:MAG: hypothetical protein GY726_13025, partial [Proteobacteria bacterium]|nr:hypothetical protein [Pseudomonadota bacterium]